MMMKRLGYAGAACLALALVFAACQNGVQEIEGSVGINYRAVSAPVVDYPLPNDSWVPSQLAPLPTYIVISWEVGSGYEKNDAFKIFGKIGDRKTYFELSSTLGGTYGKVATNDEIYAPSDAIGSSTFPKNTNIDKWYARIDPTTLVADMGLTITSSDPSEYATLLTEIQTHGILFGVQIVPPNTYGGYRVPSAITWTVPLGN